MEVYTSLDLGRLALVGLRLESRALPPAAPGAGDVYLDSTTGYPMVYTGAAWVRMAAAAITDADVATGAAIALSKLATDPLARANHTGTQLAATISDLTTRIRSNRLDQFAAPTAAVSMASQQINNLADPTSPTDAANRAFVLTQLATALLRSNHTGTQLAATISDFDSAVRLNRLDQLAAPTGPVSLAAQLLTNLADPVSAQDAATRAFVLTRVATAYARANHTGTQLASTISDLTTTIRATRLDQLAAPTSAVSLATQLLSNLADPVNPQDAATRAFVLAQVDVAQARANHTGTQLAATISDFNAAVRLNRLDQLAAPTAAVSLGAQLLTNLADPVSAQDAATRAYVLAQVATAYARANHTGTQLASTISDFNTAVRLNRLDQLAVPTAALALGAQKITGLADPTAEQDAATSIWVTQTIINTALNSFAPPTALVNFNNQRLTNVATPTASTDAANRSFVQANDWKTSVRVRVSSQTSLTAPGGVLDGVTMVAGMRVLLTAQTASADNGIYVWNSGTSLTRATDADSASNLGSGMTVYVEAGTSASTVWVCSTTAAASSVVLGTTALPFQQLTAAASKRIFNADVPAMTADVPYPFTHGLGTADLVVSVRNASSGQVYNFDTIITSTQVIITSASTVTAALRLTAISGA